MNAYSLAPLIATIAYIPLLIITAGSRPWQRRHMLFILFLISAMVWSFVVFLFRGNLLPEYNSFLFKLSMMLFAITAVQLHCFTSSFYPQGQGRWLPFAYISLLPISIIVFLGYVTSDAVSNEPYVHGSYRIGVLIAALPLLVFAARNIYVLRGMLRHISNPVLHNQISALMLCIFIYGGFTILSIPAWFKAFPIAHYGNLLTAVILRYAVTRHQLVDIKIVLRQGSAWLGLGIIGAVSYWFLLIIAHNLFDFEISLTASFAATIAGIFVAILIYRFRGYFFNMMSRAFHGASYNHRQELSNFTNTIHNVFSLKEQGDELLALLVRAFGIKQAVLLFPQTGSDEHINHGIVLQILDAFTLFQPV